MGKRIVMGQELGQLICAAMGIQTGSVTAMSINIEPNTPATITLTRVIPADEADALIKVIEQFQLMSKAS